MAKLPKTGYQTRQREAVLSYFVQHPTEHFTADALCEHLHTDGIPIGRSTVYRTLELLVSAGNVRKFTVTASDSACYQYAGDKTDACTAHFHLKCLSCGQLYHVDCSHLTELGAHIAAHHGFSVDYSKTVLYGVCAACRANSETAENGDPVDSTHVDTDGCTPCPAEGHCH